MCNYAGRWQTMSFFHLLWETWRGCQPIKASFIIFWVISSLPLVSYFPVSCGTWLSCLSRYPCGGYSAESEGSWIGFSFLFFFFYTIPVFNVAWLFPQYELKWTITKFSALLIKYFPLFFLSFFFFNPALKFYYALRLISAGKVSE